MKLWFNNKKSEIAREAFSAPVGEELSEDLMAQITGGTAPAVMSDCHPSAPSGPILTC